MMWPLIGLLLPISDGIRSGVVVRSTGRLRLPAPSRAPGAQPNGGAGERARDGACITVASRVQVPQLDLLSVGLDALDSSALPMASARANACVAHVTRRRRARRGPSR